MPDGGQAGGAGALLASAFESMLFGRVASEDLTAYAPQVLSGIASAALQRFQGRKPDVADIRIIDSREAPGRRITIVEIVNDDMPFLLASTLAELTARGCDIRLVAHPVIAVKRDAAGRLTGLGGVAGAAVPGDFQRESLIHIHIAGGLDSADRAEIVAELDRIHADIRLAVRDWAAMRARLSAVARRYRERPPLLSADEIAEAVQFLDWLTNDNFSFLGMREYRFTGIGAEPETSEGFGILSDPAVRVLREGDTYTVMTEEVQAFLRSSSALLISKTNLKSRVHRRVHMDYVGVKLIDENGHLDGELRVIGLFTSTAYTSSTRVIPYIRHKVAQVLMKAGFDPASHSGKALINVLENYPRDDLFQLDADTLYAFAMDALSLIERPRVRVLIRADQYDRFVSILAYVPKDRYDTTVRLRIGGYLAEVFEGRLSAAYPAYPEGPLARTQFIIGRNRGKTPVVERRVVEEAIEEIIQTWADRLKQTLAETEGEEEAGRLNRRYAEAFSAAYREAFTPQDSLNDIAVIERLDDEMPTAVNLYRKRGEHGGRASLKVFAHGQPIPLSRRVPMLENLGFTVDNERTYKVEPRGGRERRAFLHDMSLERARGGSIDIKAIDTRVEETLMAVLGGVAESDRFNALVAEAGLTWRQAMLLRAYGRYLLQTGAPYQLDYLADVLAKYPAITDKLVGLFDARFNPARGGTAAARVAAGEAITGEIIGMLDQVSILDEERIIRRILNLITATVRSNFYQKSADGGERPALALKFLPRQIEGLPLPRPAFEIFVHSARVDGVHMRFGPVARGGLRWSDRPADFRTEILGLVKAQHVKNSVIVPVGAKGGFVPKRLPPASDRDAWLKEGTEAYKVFIGALLDVTDTLDGIVLDPPRDVVRLDADDPYLVVAADKGTATFSDTANGISLARHFWLGDAFASGGSQGYDHKKMGITARGAWECVKRHFREMDIDIQTQAVTVAGVGDMSGDVFGNGMLLSGAIRLVAAFDHRDIFLDPDPDPARALAERKRLFALPRSSWQDYDKSLISKGGGVYSRAAKQIPISPEVRAMLGLEADSLTPQELMQAILKASVDLLWFGGIGTYIRASEETDAQAGDKANDAIRITGAMLNAKVVGEGANLGCTQRGRIEAARRGIRINTDAIDNSAGVNTSDVEVNLKIALSIPLKDQRLNEDSRNGLLAGLTDEVAGLVLRNNYLQSLALSLAQRQGAAGLAQAQRLMQALEARGRLDRAVEFLPGDPEIARRLAAGEGATRPELAVLLAYAKLSFFDDLIASDLPDDPYFADELDRYFPAAIRERFPDAVSGHRLRREIVATQLANIVINRCGPAAIARFADEAGADAPAVAAAYALTRDSFGLLDLNGAIDALDTRIGGAVQLELYAAVQAMLTGRMSWFLRNVDLGAALGPQVQRFKAGVDAARGSTLDLITPAQAEAGRQRIAEWTAKGVPEEIATRIVGLTALSAAPDAVLVAEQTGVPVAEALKTLFALAERLQVGRIKRAAADIHIADRFERLAADRAGDTMDTALRRLGGEVAGRFGTGAAGVEAFAAARAKDVARISGAIEDILASGLSQPKLTIAANLIGDLARG